MMGVRGWGREVVEWWVERVGKGGGGGNGIKGMVVGMGVWKWSG